MIITVGGVKGGTGKTTLAINLAVLEASKNKRVLLIDADDQRSSTDWFNQRREHLPSNNFECITNTSSSIHVYAKLVKDRWNTIIIDTGGRDTVSQRSAVLASNVLILPFKPRSLDLWTADKVISMYEAAKNINANLKVHICINQADPKGSDNEEAKEMLSLLVKLHAPITFIGQRKAFPNAASLGLGIIELPKQDLKAVSEIKNLLDSLYT